MLFNSIHFMVFFPVVTILYFALPHRFRWLMLLLASCVFYIAFIPIYLIILAVTITIDYAAGIWIENSQNRKRKIFLVMSIVSTCLVLFIFKYFNFFNSNLSNLARILHWNYPIGALNLILPIGLSFHTFQSMSYVIEVYRGHQKAEHNFGIYSLYVMFYPQLVAGPIERPGNMIHQFYEEHRFDYQQVTDGLKIMAWGMFKKVVIADRLAVLVNHVYSNVHDYTGAPLLIATVFFSFQIFCDFSGYSDIAIGAAQVMGFKLMLNFNRPYFSKSVGEFWTRWHISLSSWFRDYLYISLGGNRVGKQRRKFNLFVTFLVSGLWHGANFTYIIWGALNGLYMLLSDWTLGIRTVFIRLTRLDVRPRFHKILQTVCTFGMITFAWIFFRARNVHDAWYVITHMFLNSGAIASHLISGNRAALKADILQKGLGLDPGGIIVAILAILFMETVHLLQRGISIRRSLGERPSWMRFAVYYSLVFATLVFGVFNQTQFIYFQF
jgi:D-alanyl-lipoteichoic acid acyltransferase DltB (MBOAT superfamily)